MPKLAANLTMLFTELDFLDRFEAASLSGFKGVEYLSPYEYDKEMLVEQLRSNNLVQVLHNIPMGNWDSGDRGIGCDPDRVDEFQDGIPLAVEYAKALGCEQVNCLAGIAPIDIEDSKLRSTLVSNLKFAASNLQNAGIKLLLEAINTRDIPGFFVNTTKQALSIIEEVGSNNLSFQYDAYHMQIMEGDIVPTIRSNFDSISHIQIADNPGRNEPGTGEINYSFVLDSIDRMGYEGWIGCEYKPLSTTEEGLGWTKPYLIG